MGGPRNRARIIVLLRPDSEAESARRCHDGSDSEHLSESRVEILITYPVERRRLGAEKRPAAYLSTASDYAWVGCSASLQPSRGAASESPE